MFKDSKFLFILCSLIVGIQLCVHGQIDTSLVLTEIEILVEPERSKNFGSKTQIICQKENLRSLGQDLGQVLNQSAGIYIKSYGANSLATSSIRGGSAGHTLILWNGIPLVNPSLGLVDFALIPAGQTDLISLHKGGNSALWGSGAIGGVINLQTNTKILKSKSSIAAQIGSFGQAILDGHAEYKKGIFSASTNISFQKANNNFKFRAADNLPIQELENAGFVNNNISQNLFFELGKKSKLAIHYWWQGSNKEIPATLTQVENLSNQSDTANRFLIDWKLINNKSKVQAKLGVLKENQIYEDPVIQLRSENAFTSLISELNFTKSIKEDHLVLLGSTFTATDATTNGYQDGVQENKIGLWSSYRYNANDISLQLSARTENIDGLWIPVTPSIGVDYKVSRQLILAGKISRNYRLPTLNDRFWIPGGNQNLLPENGWSQELSIHTNFDFWDLSNISVTAFNRRIKNWILWSPMEGQALWNAQNLGEVWSRGIEIESRQSIKINKLVLGLESYYNLVRSTNEIAISLPKIAKGEQLIYTPIHQLTNTLSFQKDNFLVAINHIYRSKNKGINEDLNAYHLFNVNIEYKELSLWNQKVDFRLSINNPFGTQYFIVERRPMPLSNFNLGLRININK